MMQALANSAAFWVLLILVLCAVYLLPTIIGVARRVDRLALVFLVNLIGGTTGVGWLAALILAFGPRRLSPVPPSTSVRSACWEGGVVSQQVIKEAPKHLDLARLDELRSTDAEDLISTQAESAVLAVISE